MKKILIVSLVLGMMLPLTGFAQQGVSIGPVKFQVGLNQFPGKNYWVDELYKWDGSAWRMKLSQEEESFHVSLLSIRASTMKPISPNLSAGLVVGCEMPISSWKKEWKNAAGDIWGVPPEVTEYTEIDFEILGWLDWPQEEYTQSLELKQRILVVPILGKLAYTFPSQGRMKVDTGLAFGAYVINSRITGTLTYTFVEDDPPYETGDEEILESTVSNTACAPGGEFSVQLSLPVSPRVSIGLNGWLGYIGKTVAYQGTEYTGYAPIEWTPAAPELATLKLLMEVGGLSFGGGLSLNLFF